MIPSPQRPLVHAQLDEDLFDLDTLCRASAVTPGWVIERIEAGLLCAVQGQASASVQSTQWRFDAITVRRVRQMRRVERDFDAVPELAALVSDLLDEIATLKAQLRHR